MTNFRRRKKKVVIKSAINKFNKQINYPEVRVIDEVDGFVGIMSSVEANKLAMEKDLDLVEINPKSTPPVVKIMDFNKFKYQKSKLKNNKSTVEKDKTIRVSVSIGPHDLKVRAIKCDKLLESKYTVKLQVQMKGRQKAHPHVAEEVIYELLNMITKPFIYIQEPKLIADSYFSTIKLKS